MKRKEISKKTNSRRSLSFNDAHRTETEMWRMYYALLPSLKGGKHWIPKNAEELMFAEKLVQQSILERFAGEYILPDEREDDFACGSRLR